MRRTPFGRTIGVVATAAILAVPVAATTAGPAAANRCAPLECGDPTDPGGPGDPGNPGDPGGQGDPGAENCTQQDHDLVARSMLINETLGTMTSHIRWCWNSNGMVSVSAYAPTSRVPASPSVVMELSGSDGPGYVDTAGTGHFTVSATLTSTFAEKLGPLTVSCAMTIDAVLMRGAASEYYDVNGCKPIWESGSSAPEQATLMQQPPDPGVAWPDWPVQVVDLNPVDDGPGGYGEVVGVNLVDPVTGDLVDATDTGHIGGGTSDPVWAPYFDDEDWYGCMAEVYERAID